MFGIVFAQYIVKTHLSSLPNRNDCIAKKTNKHNFEITFRRKTIQEEDSIFLKGVKILCFVLSYLFSVQNQTY